MKVIDVYSRYFAAECVYNGVERRGALVRLTATSDAGRIRYDFGLSFFPHREEDDFAVSYDACAEETVFDAPGRRSKKREEALLPQLRERVDALAASLGGTVDWDKPLGEARNG